MEINAELDKWAAESCGVFVQERSRGQVNEYFEYDNGVDGTTIIEDFWTLSDARCREIVREYFIITTRPVRKGESWFASSDKEKEHGVEVICVIGKTIAEAEIACIAAIMDAE